MMTARNPQANYTIERIHQVLGNFIQISELDNNYVYEDESWKGILVSESFANHSRFHETVQNHLTN